MLSVFLCLVCTSTHIGYDFHPQTFGAPGVTSKRHKTSMFYYLIFMMVLMMAAPFIRSRCFDLWTYAYLSLTDDNGVIYIAADGTSSTMAMMTSRIPDVHVGSVCFSNGVLLTSVDVGSGASLHFINGQNGCGGWFQSVCGVSGRDSVQDSR